MYHPKKQQSKWEYFLIQPISKLLLWTNAIFVRRDLHLINHWWKDRPHWCSYKDVHIIKNFKQIWNKRKIRNYPQLQWWLQILIIEWLYNGRQSFKSTCLIEPIATLPRIIFYFRNWFLLVKWWQRMISGWFFLVSNNLHCHSNTL